MKVCPDIRKRQVELQVVLQCFASHPPPTPSLQIALAFSSAHPRLSGLCAGEYGQYVQLAGRL